MEQENNRKLIRSLTPARIALGRSGLSIPISEQLAFKQAHAMARDAVFSVLDKENIINAIKSLGHSVIELHSSIQNRKEYLLRPDLGKKLNTASLKRLEEEMAAPTDICLIIADGLSANAANRYAIPVLQFLLPELQKAGYKIGGICIAEEARVALGDEIALRLKAKLCLTLIGERPGLSSSESMGAYLTFNPVVGSSDAKRNCISNIGAGLSAELSAKKLIYLINESFQLKLSGLLLKDNFPHDRDLLLPTH